MVITEFACEVCDYLRSLPEVKSCGLYGSVSRGSFDEYSDIDIEIDVSGTDNGAFALKLPQLFGEKYRVLFYDYAPSLAPEKYIVSLALCEDNPFMLVDISCWATPHCTSVTKRELSERNNKIDHTMKLFSANLKHYLRGADCYGDILKMHSRIFGDEAPRGVKQMLEEVYSWLLANSESRHAGLLEACRKYMPTR